MSENENLRTIILKTLEQLDQLILRENSADKVTKMVTDETNKLASLQKDVMGIQEEIKRLTGEKGKILANAKVEAEAIIHEAEAKEKEVSSRLSNIKRLERIAQEHKEEAEAIRATHQTILADVTAQKAKLRAALVG